MNQGMNLLTWCSCLPQSYQFHTPPPQQQPLMPFSCLNSPTDYKLKSKLHSMKYGTLQNPTPILLYHIHRQTRPLDSDVLTIPIFPLSEGLFSLSYSSVKSSSPLSHSPHFLLILQPPTRMSPPLWKISVLSGSQSSSPRYAHNTCSSHSNFTYHTVSQFHICLFHLFWTETFFYLPLCLLPKPDLPEKMLNKYLLNK